MDRLKTFFFVIFMLLLMAGLLAQSTVAPGNAVERIRAFTRMTEFDYLDWTLDAVLIKNIQEAVKAPRYMSYEEQRDVVFEYLRLVSWVNSTTREVERIYANPDIQNPDQAAKELNEQLNTVRTMEQNLKPIAEAVLEHQVSTTVAELGLTVGGQPIPPVLYHVTRLPTALIVSPRGVIAQEANISLQPDMTPEETARLENDVETNLDYSALVVPIGGVGTYPTMVMSTTDLNWLLEVVSHEWIHNYLTLRPVGALYMASGEMRTINETTANIAGKEIGRAVIERYYPELAPPPAPKIAEPAVLPEPPVQEGLDENIPAPTPVPEEPGIFSFNREMHKTRLRVDELLAAKKITEAEQYMEQRRRFFWENGYQIRRLNQAYFAFYGAYNDVPGGGAAGQDPVGPAVQALRARSTSLADFLRRMTWVTSFKRLQQEINRPQ
jgi:hypothetical protein